MSEELTWDVVREQLQILAEQRGDWAGYPVPVNDLKLVLAPTFPYQGLNGFVADEESADANKIEEIIINAVLGKNELINYWYSARNNKEIQIYKNKKTNKYKHYVVDSNTAGRRLTYAVNTLGASLAWDIKAEFRAMATIEGMLNKSQFEYYILTGGFLETSERSGVTYYFRKLRPTVCLRPDGDGMRILAALCLHPIGHYEESFAGVMVPTDDVISHLQMMRADEHKFWAKANHHNSYEASSGI